MNQVPGGRLGDDNKDFDNGGLFFYTGISYYRGEFVFRGKYQ